MWDATIQEEAISYIFSYQTLTADKNQLVIKQCRGLLKSGRMYATIAVKLLNNHVLLCVINR